MTLGIALGANAVIVLLLTVRVCTPDRIRQTPRIDLLGWAYGIRTVAILGLAAQCFFFVPAPLGPDELPALYVAWKVISVGSLVPFVFALMVIADAKGSQTGP